MESRARAIKDRADTTPAARNVRNRTYLAATPNAVPVNASTVVVSQDTALTTNVLVRHANTATARKGNANMATVPKGNASMVTVMVDIANTALARGGNAPTGHAKAGIVTTDAVAMAAFSAAAPASKC